jgi:hypothetical protein
VHIAGRRAGFQPAGQSGFQPRVAWIGLALARTAGTDARKTGRLEACPTRACSGGPFLDVLDKVHELSAETVDTRHVITISKVYEGLLLKMGEKGNDGGQDGAGIQAAFRVFGAVRG